MTLAAFQRIILQMYGEKDAARGDAATFLWLTEEFGELATALRSGTQDELAAEMADVLAWLATLANIRGVDLEAAVLRKYGGSCPGCRASPVRLRPGREAVTTRTGDRAGALRPVRSIGELEQTRVFLRRVTDCAPVSPGLPQTPGMSTLHDS